RRRAHQVQHRVDADLHHQRQELRRLPGHGPDGQGDRRRPGGRQVTPARTMRRFAFGVALSFAAAGAWASIADPQADDMALGNPKAKVTVIEYASVGCPHCADWDQLVFPALKAKYVDKGKVRFVVREMATGD